MLDLKSKDEKELVKKLFRAVLTLENSQECDKFFEDICTVAELKAIAQRLEVADMLSSGRTYVDIVGTTKASTATISRVKRCLNYGAEGYSIVLNRLKEEPKAKESTLRIHAKEQESDMVMEIPYGTRDYLPAEAARKRQIETKLAQLFERWGYNEVVTPTIELLDTLTAGSSGRALEAHMFKFFDRSNRTVALRHEMTTPIARLVASRLGREARPLRLSYLSNVYRYEQAQTGRQCEFYQAGVEFMGSDSAAADAEVIALAIECLRQTGLKEFQLCLGQVEFINGLMEQFDLPVKLRAEIRAKLETHDLVGLGRLVAQSELSNECKEALRAIPVLHGGTGVIAKARELTNNEHSLAALQKLEEIYRLVEAYGLAEYVCFDLGVIRDFSYYTGMVFEVYSPGLGFPICGGGRYDTMLADFGTECPATGFALGIERLMLALERGGQEAAEVTKDVYVAYASEQRLNDAIRRTGKLRAEGKSVCLATQPQTKADATAYQKEKRCVKLVYLS